MHPPALLLSSSPASSLRSSVSGGWRADNMELMQHRTMAGVIPALAEFGAVITGRSNPGRLIFFFTYVRVSGGSKSY